MTEQEKKKKMSQKIKAQKIAEKREANRLSEKEKQERLELTDYVVKLLGYENNMKPPKQLFMRIEGLRCGEFIPTGHKTGVHYPYPIIRYTFMAMAGAINSALKSVEFKNESHKINYVLVIIEKNINDIYNAVKRNREAKEKLEKKEVYIDLDVPNRFIGTEKSKVSEMFDDDIW